MTSPSSWHRPLYSVHALAPPHSTSARQPRHTPVLPSQIGAPPPHEPGVHGGGGGGASGSWSTHVGGTAVRSHCWPFGHTLPFVEHGTPCCGAGWKQPARRHMAQSALTRSRYHDTPAP